MTRPSIRSVQLIVACLFAVAGCNPKGTCVVTSDDTTEAGGDSCIVNMNKKACESFSRSPEFFAENGVQGTLRCKSAGFDGKNTKGKDELYTYFKNKK